MSGFHKVPKVPSRHRRSTVISLGWKMSESTDASESKVKGQRSETELSNDLNLKKTVLKSETSCSILKQEMFPAFSNILRDSDRWSHKVQDLPVWKQKMADFCWRHDLSSQKWAGHPHKCTLAGPFSITTIPQLFPSSSLLNSLKLMRDWNPEQVLDETQLLRWFEWGGWLNVVNNSLYSSSSILKLVGSLTSVT